MTKYDHDSFILDALPIVDRVMREVAVRIPTYIDRSALRSAGYVGLIEAANAFDAQRGVPFAAYARHRVRGAVLDELRDMDWCTRTTRALARRVAQLRAQALPADEISAITGLTERELRRLDLDVSRATLNPLDGADNALEIASPGDLAEECAVRADLTKAVRALPLRLRFVVEQTYLADRKSADVAQELGISRARMAQLRAEAVQRLAVLLAA
jgi:RNA polymerase sigma factor for flagellar operon FliA